MDDFDNFFNNEPERQQERTPIYHTPSGHEPPSNKERHSTSMVVWMVIAIVMTMVVLVNIVVLATLKSQIAADYEAKIAEQMQDSYNQAISDVLSDSSIIADVTNAASETATANALKTVGEIAAEKSSSVARIVCTYSKDSNSKSMDGCTGSGFLVSPTVDGTRYIVTCAHIVEGVLKTTTSTGGMFGYSAVTYSYEYYDQIYCYFNGDVSPSGNQIRYELEIVACGDYKADETIAGAVLAQSDLAILRFKSSSEIPSDTTHPALSLASTAYTAAGESVALIGNPLGIGISVSSGTVSQSGISMEELNWGVGNLVMTDAAVNGGNSGGPMVNNAGTVVGVVESKLVSSSIDNMGFAVAADTLIAFIRNAETDNILGTTIELTDHITLISRA